MKKVLFLSVSVLLFFNAELLAQSDKDMKIIEKGTEHFQKNHFKKALETFSEVEDKNGEVYHRMGLCQLKLFNYPEAEKTLKKGYDADNSASDYALDYAKVLVYNERYDKAIKVLQETKSLEGNNIAVERVKGYGWALQQLEDEENFDFEVVQTDINTGGRSMGLCLYNDGAIFSIPQKDKEEERVFYDLAFAEIKDSASFGSPSPLLGEYSSNFYDGSPSVDQKGTLYFTSNASDKEKFNPKKSKDLNISENGENVLNIFSTSNQGGTWKQPEKLNINTIAYNTTHPFITPDGSTLFFASDKPNGEGGLDLYFSEKEGSSWGEPQNLGANLNTSEHEMYPFFKNDTLYFASYGHKGFGGADIFYSVKEGGTWTGPVNMGRKINSNRDDFGLVLKEDGRSGYFSSNRGSGQGEDKIFFFVKVKEEIVADTFQLFAEDKFSHDKIKDITVTLKSGTKVNGEYHKEKISSSSNGIVDIPLFPETEYEVTISGNGYHDKSIKLNESLSEKRIKAKIEGVMLNPKMNKNDILTLDEIYFEYDKASIKAESFGTLDKLADYLRKLPDIKIELSAHTDSRASSRYNKELSQKRAEMCRKYLLLEEVNPSRVVAKGYGESKLVNGCKDGVECSEEEHQKNRRVEVKIL